MEKDRIVESRKLQEAIKSLPVREHFATGFERLDLMLKGVREGDLIVLSGLPGTGKSQFFVSLAKNMEQYKPLFFSFEMDAIELFERFNKDVPVFYLPLSIGGTSPAWIEKKINESILKFGSRIVFIDHLHYMVDSITASNRNTTEIVGSYVRQLKLIARRTRTAIFLACHVRKLVEKGDWRKDRPDMNDLKDSSALSQESDIVMFLHRKGKKKKSSKEMDEELEEANELVAISNDAWLFIDKVRHHGGILGRIMMTLNADGFYEEVR